MEHRPPPLRSVMRLLSPWTETTITFLYSCNSGMLTARTYSTVSSYFTEYHWNSLSEYRTQALSGTFRLRHRPPRCWTLCWALYPGSPLKNNRISLLDVEDALDLRKIIRIATNQENIRTRNNVGLCRLSLRKRHVKSLYRRLDWLVDNVLHLLSQKVGLWGSKARLNEIKRNLINRQWC